jgi:hypothetical protein
MAECQEFTVVSLLVRSIQQPICSCFLRSQEEVFGPCRYEEQEHGRCSEKKRHRFVMLLSIKHSQGLYASTHENAYRTLCGVEGTIELWFVIDSFRIRTRLFRSSVPDPKIFVMDPDPRIFISELRIRIQIRILAAN